MQTKIILNLDEATNICKDTLANRLSQDAGLSGKLEVIVEVPHIDIKIKMVKFLRQASIELAKANKIAMVPTHDDFGNITLFDAKTYVEDYMRDHWDPPF